MTLEWTVRRNRQKIGKRPTKVAVMKQEESLKKARLPGHRCTQVQREVVC